MEIKSYLLKLQEYQCHSGWNRLRHRNYFGFSYRDRLIPQAGSISGLSCDWRSYTGNIIVRGSTVCTQLVISPIKNSWDGTRFQSD